MKRLIVWAVVICTVFCFTGCNVMPKEVTETNMGTTVTVDKEKEDSIHIRDKELLYNTQTDGEVVTMYLTVTKGNSGEGTDHTWEEVNTYSAYDYDEWGVERYKVAGLLQVGNEEGLVEGELGYGQVSPNCTVQIRGQTSSKSPQKNYKIKLRDNEGEWRGQTTIALNKHQTEGLRYRNKLGFDLLRGIDEIMSLRTTFVHLYVKDLTESDNASFVDYGIYTQVEQLNKTALEAHGLDKRGHLYKVNTCEFYRYEDIIKLVDDPTYDQKAFDELLEVKGDDDHSKLIKVLEKINDYSIPMEDILNEHFDIENMAYWMAFQILTGNVDTQNRNFYLYSPLNIDRFYILPWDLDGMLKRTEYSVKKRSDYIEWETGVSNYWGNVLFRRALKTEVYREVLDKAVEDIKAYLTPDRMSSMIDGYVATVKPYLYSGRDLLYAPLTQSEHAYISDKLPTEIDLNYNLYKESFKKPLPFFIGVPLLTNGQYELEWDPSYDFEGEDLTYTFELAKDCYFKNMVYKEENIVVPVVKFDKLPKGQYFVRVKAYNESGYSQYAFDSYITETGKIYGTKSFYVGADGKVTEG